MLDDVLDVRTIELWIRYDADVVSNQGGASGQLFAESGCTLFPIFEEDAPGAGTRAASPWAQAVS